MFPQKALEMAVENEKNHQKQFINHRVEICLDRHDRRSCKICSSCVNFPGKQHNFSHNLRRTTRFTQTKCDFVLKLLKFYTLR